MGYYSGQGRVYEAKRDVDGKPMGFAWLGNVPVMDISVEITKFEHVESYSGQRATDLTVVQEKKGTFTMTLEDMDIKNLALAFWGQSAVVAAGTGVTTEITAYLEKRSAFPYPNVSNAVIQDDAEIITYEFGPSVDDAASKNGWIDEVNGAIYVFSDAEQTTRTAAANIADADILHVTSYDHGAAEQMDAFTETSQERWLRFEGLNTVDGNAVVVNIFKANLDPLSGYALINEELSSFEITGSVLFDDLQPGDSKFFQQTNVNA